jgi:tetratricopeptide (TPR) repeat protein
MTTVIIIIISVVALGVIGAKIFLGSPSKTSRSKAPDSDKASPPANKKNEGEAILNKAIKTASAMNIKNLNLFQPPPEHPLFTGRKEILKNIVAKAAASPILIGLSGMSGIGKTCLTIPLFKIYTSKYPDTCLFVDMQGDLQNPPSPEDMMRKIILKFHPTQPLPANEKQLAKLYRVALKKHKGILILDNASGTKQVKPLAPPPSWLLIVTSTKPVTLPKLVSIDLEPMDALEAQTLLTRWSPEISPSLKEINAICKGVPLALDIVGKLFAINSTMKPDYFAKKFMEARAEFGEDKKGSFIEGVRASLSYSYRALPEKTAMVLRKLSVFPGSFTADAASFICEDPKNLSLVGLEKFGLIQQNANTGRFSLHYQVKRFIKPLLKAGDRGMLEKRHATEFMNVLETAFQLTEKGGKDAIKGFRIFDLELENIQAGLEWSRDNCSQDKDAARVCSAYAECGATMIGQRLSPSECIQWFEAALLAASQLDDKEAEGKHLLNLGQQYVLINQLPKAIETLQSALAFCKKDGNVEGQGTALEQMSQICMMNDDHEQHIKLVEEHLELVRSDGSKIEEFKLLVELTQACVKNKEFNKVIHIGEQAMELAPINQDKVLLLYLLHSLGMGLRETGEEGKALEKFEVAVGLSEKTPKAPLLGELFQMIGEMVYKSGDIPGALKNLKRGLEAVQKTKNLKAEGSLMIQLAEIHMESQGEEQAINYFDEALSISKKSKDLSMKGRVLWSSSQAFGKKGNLEEAISRAQKALKIYEDLNPSEAGNIRTQIEKWAGS